MFIRTIKLIQIIQICPNTQDLLSNITICADTLLHEQEFTCTKCDFI